MPIRATTSPAHDRNAWTGNGRSSGTGSVNDTWNHAMRDGSDPESGPCPASFIPQRPPDAFSVASVSHPIADDLATNRLYASEEAT